MAWIDTRQLMDAVEPAALVAFAQRLVRVDSQNPPGRESLVAEAVAEQGRAWGLSARLEPVAEGRANVVVSGSAPRREEAEPELVFCGHLDTVPFADSGWRHDPLGGDVVGGRLWGRGSVDMKGAVAAMLAGMAALAVVDPEAAARTTFLGVVGEEVDCAGSRHAVDAGVVPASARWLVVGEPTDLRLVITHKGALRIRIALHGQSAHSSRPELGVNAVVHMATVVEALSDLALASPRHPLLGPPTASITGIDGGTAVNVVPDGCHITVDVRTLPGQDHDAVIEQVEAVVGDVAGRVPGLRHVVTRFYDVAPVVTDPREPLVRAGIEAARTALGREDGLGGATYFSDASVLQPATGMPTLLVGPGEVALMHQVDESVSVDDLVGAARLYSVLPALLMGQAR